jgi:hypothetical protein
MSSMYLSGRMDGPQKRTANGKHDNQGEPIDREHQGGQKCLSAVAWKWQRGEVHRRARGTRQAASAVALPWRVCPGVLFARPASRDGIGCDVGQIDVRLRQRPPPEVGSPSTLLHKGAQTREKELVTDFLNR